MKFLHGTGLLPTTDEMRSRSEDENLAILESLFLTLLADGKVAPPEVKAFAVSVLTYPWNWGNAPDTIKSKLDVIAARFKGVTRATMVDHLRGLGPRIPTAALREKTFAGMFSLMISDGKLDEKEKKAALVFASVFEINQARTIEIIQGVMSALKAALQNTE